jgi:polyisoprenoid-binding protein YceI
MLRRTMLATVLAATLAGPAAAADYTVDPAHSQATFTVSHLTVTKVSGQIPVQSAQVSAGPNDLPTKVDATLDLKGVDTREPDRDRDLRSDDFFDVAKYPTMTFVSKKIEGTPGAFTISGDLTFHGVTKPIALAAKLEGKVTDGKGRTHLGYTATATIDRRDWGLNWGKTNGGALIVGNEVTISLTVEAVSKG